MITISDDEFKSLSSYIKKFYGIDLTKKKGLIEGRLSNVISERFNSLTEYLEYIFSHPNSDDAKKLISKLTTNYTYFMREAAHFKYFSEEVVPYLVNKISDKDMRIWSAGCSSGEEPYTLAMIIHDHLGDKIKEWDTKILATDISAKALGEAKQGIYQKKSLQDLPPLWKLKYFDSIDNDNFKICNSIKEDIIFRSFNLMEETYPFKRKFHVIFCRNVMIYFDMDTKRKLIRKLFDYTEPGGYLFIGHSESLNRNDSGFEYIMPSVYRKP